MPERDSSHLDPRAAPAAARLQAGGALLITRLRYTGDVLLSLPLFAAARRAFPAARIHALVEAGARPVLEAQPEIDALWTAQPGITESLALMRCLRHQRFDVAIDLFCNARSALLVRATGAPVRIGEARRVRRHLYTTARQLPAGRSALQQHLDALRALGVDPGPASPPRLRLRPEERARGVAVWKSWTAHPGVVLHPAATQRAKEWPLDHAVELVRRLGADSIPVLVTTAPGRSALTAEIVAQSDGAARALPPGGLRQVWAVVAAAAALVAVDGGIAHAGVALGRPTVALFGPTVPEIWFPYESFGPYRVLHAGIDCDSCDRVHCAGRTCMAALEPRYVLATLAELWAGPLGRAAP